MSLTTARLAGSGSAACKSALFADSSAVNCTLASRLSSEESDAPARSAKLRLTVSNKGSCMRLMRWAEKSYGRTASLPFFSSNADTSSSDMAARD